MLLSLRKGITSKTFLLSFPYYTWGGYNDLPWGILALEPSRLFQETPDFGTIHIWYWEFMTWIFGAQRVSQKEFKTWFLKQGSKFKNHKSIWPQNWNDNFLNLLWTIGLLDLFPPPLPPHTSFFLLLSLPPTLLLWYGLVWGGLSFDIWDWGWRWTFDLYIDVKKLWVVVGGGCT